MFTILGESGYIGGHLSANLQEQGAECFTPDRGDSEIFTRDLGHVIYSIGLTADFRTRSYDTVRAHVCVLAEMIEKCKFNSFLYLSSTRVYADLTSSDEAKALLIDPNRPGDLYNISKLMGESLCLSNQNQNIRVARLSNVVGNDISSDNFLASIIREAVDNNKVILGTGLASEKDYVTIEDVVNILPKIAIGGNHRLYNIASGINISNSILLDSITKNIECVVEVAEGAKEIIFPQISIKRLQEEFDFVPSSVIDSIPKMIDKYYQHKISS